MISILNIIFWTIIIACFILSFVGLIYPIIPSVFMIWGGVVIYHFGINPNELSWISWTTMIVLTILLFLADYLANLHFVEKAGGTKWGMRAATIGLILGSFIFPPFGILIVPFTFVLVSEMLQKKTIQDSFKVAFATVIAFLSGTFAKMFLQLMMIVVFTLDVIF